MDDDKQPAAGEADAPIDPEALIATVLAMTPEQRMRLILALGVLAVPAYAPALPYQPVYPLPLNLPPLNPPPIYPGPVLPQQPFQPNVAPYDGYPLVTC